MQSHVIKIDAAIDWSAPWLSPFFTLGREIAANPDWRRTLTSAAQQRHLHNHFHLPLHFVAQHELPSATAYETFISTTGKVPTRDNLHDFFNALVWLTFSRIKAQLNVLQAKQIAKYGVGQVRGAKRDAATLFDENAALLVLTNTLEGRAIEHALRTHQWYSLFIQQREQFKMHAEVFLFGHALMEKLVRPYKAITAHTLICWVEADFFKLTLDEKCQQLDQQMAHRLMQIDLLPTEFSPLPVLGIPDWWPNQTVEFYADATVFRPRST